MTFSTAGMGLGVFRDSMKEESTAKSTAAKIASKVVGDMELGIAFSHWKVMGGSWALNINPGDFINAVQKGTDITKFQNRLGKVQGISIKLDNHCADNSTVD